MQRDLDKVIASLATQGCRIRRTRAGVFVYCPDGKTTIGFHLSKHSDIRTIRNIRAEVLRVGLKWPQNVSA